MTTRTEINPRTVDDMRWRFREAMHEDLGRIIRHAEYAQRYLEDGADLLSSFHIDEIRRRFKNVILTHNEKAALEAPAKEGT
jgi:hypothetical protein